VSRADILQSAADHVLIRKRLGPENNMLVIISDLHLTDDTSGKTIRENAFGVFRERLRDMAFDASWRSDGKYKPIEKLDVLLLGDILDVIRSSRWIGAGIRPWNQPSDPLFSKTVAEITQAILAKNAKSVEILRSLSNGTILTLPPATAEGKPELGVRERVPISVRLHAMVGNHDWFFHLPGDAYDQIRKIVVKELGLANDPLQPFPHDPQESEELQKVFADHHVFARHGDIFDAFNFEEVRNASSLGDAIVIELINRFPVEVQRQLGSELTGDCLVGLREIDNVRPLLVVPVWINGLLRRTCIDNEQAAKVKAIWDKLADDFLALDFVSKRLWTKRLFGSVAKLEWALKFSRGVSFGNLSEITSWVTRKLASHDELFYPNAFGETAFKNRSARFIVYGHTHHHEIVPLDIFQSANGQVTQIYINSGTWRAVHDQAQFHLQEQEFAGYHVMTYLGFFKDDERSGRPFETWSGSLGWKDTEG